MYECYQNLEIYGLMFCHLEQNNVVIYLFVVLDNCNYGLIVQFGIFVVIRSRHAIPERIVEAVTHVDSISVDWTSLELVLCVTDILQTGV